MIEFEYLLVFALLPLPILIYCFVPSHQTPQLALKVPFFNALASSLGLRTEKGSSQIKVGVWQRSSLVLGWFLVVLAAAKPVWLGPEETRELTGRDVMMVLDLSGSMATDDLSDSDGNQVTRLAASKDVLDTFSQKRKGDRLGLIVFGDSAFLQSPFTADHSAWLALLNETEPAMAGQSTHLGDAIGLGIKTFLSENQKDKQEQPSGLNSGQSNSIAQDSHSDEHLKREHLMIVLTDGNDTDSLVPPIDAAKVAAAHNIKIHLVAMGSPNTSGEQAIDMDVIDTVAKLTGGRSFLAMSPSELSNVYDIINELEPSVFESYRYQPKQSLHYVPLLIAFIYHLLFMVARSLLRLRMKPETQSTGGYDG
ncbi:BatA (Bacteroides aerotolerance operon) [Vibrio chagasii]|uniref:VWA domain-containing protein n=1 Tax=Vibrio TaxID=662 RepID=UPI000E32B07F|nr:MULTISPECIES: VWA domain-containing protein [Vibrio]MCG9562590.1 VWA domain-containing protein [Vibrio chagasii]MCG9565279.1 VWA domain-containing protein [Vibrio chagasii]CAH6784281.1 BatA (Bacteroides aerotolerance operon) [Vibrio chagasii]CAH6832711.1 BatA (Bacteroides aerotolerance operon) [Vibrio chagasii]CAH6844609.1 BatA (Bacteroides aerotolerance operon) [Vibrio chagasii]